MGAPESEGERQNLHRPRLIGAYVHVTRHTWRIQVINLRLSCHTRCPSH